MRPPNTSRTWLFTSLKVVVKFRWHALLWVVMFFYFIFAPDLYTLVFTQNGKPLQVDTNIPAESDEINFVIEDLVPHVKDGENLYELIGWSFIIPEEGVSTDLFVREIALISNEKTYFFSVRSEHREPELPKKFADINIKFDTLGLSALIAEDTIRPGKYRIGIVFRNTSNGSAFYCDKPTYYLIKTPNTLYLERK
jgi:hypothetical protein